MATTKRFRTVIRNHTNVPEELLREFIRYAKPSGLPGIEFEFKNTTPGRWRAWAYSSGVGIYDYRKANGRKARHPSKPFVTVYVPRTVNGMPQPEPVRGYDNRRDVSRARRFQRGYLTGGYWTDHEHLLHLIAHEIRHVWQRKVRKGWRVWGARGQMSEKDADAFAIRTVRKWRRGE
jgi:hypothetical protein